MRPSSLFRFTALLSCAVLAACVDTRGSGQRATTDPTTALNTPTSNPTLTIGTSPSCPYDATQLRALGNTAFGAGSPDAQSVIGKINSLEADVLAGNAVSAGQRGFDIIEFTLRKNSQRPLPGGTAAVTTFVNAVACYSGLDFIIEDPNSTTVVNPTDGARVIYSADRLAGLSLEANSVSEQTIFSIVPIPFTPAEPGDGPLNTKLDQYKGFYNFTKTSANNLPLAKNVVVGVCAPASLSATLFAQLRLGHNASTGFRLEPLAPADFLDCSTAYTSAEAKAPKTDFFGSGFLGRVAAIFTPREAFAAVATSFFAGGGVGGLASELSPFAPVDATLSLAGGVGGLASELRVLQLEAAPNSCSSTEAPAGNAIEAGCRPKVVLTTALGTPLAGAPITFTVTVGGGRVAPQNPDGSCGTFGTTIVTNTLTDGSVQVCWTLGSTAGQNRLRAVGGIGGDVPAGVTYSDARFFTATGNPPTGFVFIEQPAAGQQVIAGTVIPVQAALVDKNGVIVTSYTGSTTLSLRRAGNAATFGPGTQTVVNAVAGVATFAPVSITAANTGYALRVSNTSFSADGNAFDVVAASAFTMSIVQGDGQSALAGTVLPVNPTVVVRDQFSNPVKDVVVSWAAGGSSGGSVTPITSTTGADGRASTVWTVGSGANELLATAGTLAPVRFSATGTIPSLATLNQCPTGGGGDPFNDPAKPFAFFIPDPGNGKTIREITVYVSSSGQANDITAHNLRLTVTRATFDPNSTPIQSAVTTTFLRGNNSETKAVTFTLPEPIVGASGQSARKVMLRLSTFGPNAATAKLNFNSGTCSPNSTTCRVVNTCRVTEVSSPLPYPEGTFYRQSVGIIVRGN